MLESLPLRGKQPVILTVTNSAGEITCKQTSYNGRVNTGAQAMLGQMFGTAAQPAAFNFVALSTNSAAAIMPDTAASFTAAGEITTNGLARKQATYAYVTAPGTFNGNAQATLSATWTATGGGVINSIGALNAITGGTLGLETVLSSVVSYNNTDTISLAWTLNQQGMPSYPRSAAYLAQSLQPKLSLLPSPLKAVLVCFCLTLLYVLELSLHGKLQTGPLVCGKMPGPHKHFQRTQHFKCLL